MKYRAKNGFLWSISTDSKEAAFVILMNHAKRAYQKGKIESHEQSKKEGQPK